MEYLFNNQKDFLSTNNPLELKEMNQQIIAKELGFSPKSGIISRLIKNLTIELPNKEVIFAKDLIPRYSGSISKGIYLINELKKNSKLYDNKKKEFLVTDKELQKEFLERFAVKVHLRTINKYRRLSESDRD